MTEETENASGENDLIRVLFIDDEFIEYRSLKKTIASVADITVDIEYSQSIEDAVEKIKRGAFDLILLDNRLLPKADFRETVPLIRGVGYTGPIGVVSTDITDGYFQEFQEYGADFRIGKDEIDPKAIQHMIREYVRYEMPDFWKEDYNL